MPKTVTAMWASDCDISRRNSSRTMIAMRLPVMISGTATPCRHAYQVSATLHE